MPHSKTMGRGANGAGSIRKRTVTKNGKEYTYYEARYTSGFDPCTGKQIQRSISGKSQQEVRQKLSRVTADIDEGTYIPPNKQLLEEWLHTWLDTYVVHSVKPYTRDAYRATCENHIIPVLGKIKLMVLSPPQIQQLYNKLLDKGLSPKTIKNIHGVLHRALNQAVRIGLLRNNPSDYCDLPKAYHTEIVPLEQEQVSQLLEAIRGNRFQHIYEVTLFTGLRQGEILGLTWDCVDFETSTIFINKQLTKSSKVGGEYMLAPTKTGRSRIIAVAPSVMTVFRRQKSLQAQQRLLAGPAWRNEWDLVFTDPLGGHLAHLTVYKDFKDICRSIGLEKTRFHDLRHSYAVACIESGDDIKTVQANLGHATAAFTLNVYAHVTSKMRQQSAQRMEQYIRKVSGTNGL